MSIKIENLEDKLKTAMLNSDVATLDQLLADDLIFTNHLGQTLSKQDDLSAHRTGFVNIRSIDQSEQQTKCRGDVAIVSVLSKIQGEFGNQPSDIALRFTRVWQKQAQDNWQVIAAHSSQLNDG